MWLGTIRRLGLYFGPLMLGSAAARALCAASCPDVAGAMFAGGERAPVNGLMLAVAHWKQQRGELEFRRLHESD